MPKTSKQMIQEKIQATEQQIAQNDDRFKGSQAVVFADTLVPALRNLKAAAKLIG